MNIQKNTLIWPKYYEHTGFCKYLIEIQRPGIRLFHYIDKPDTNMNELVEQVEKSLNKKLSAVRLPYWLGYMGGLSFDLLAKITGKKFPVSAVRVKKFCLPRRKERPYRGATTQFDATANSVPEPVEGKVPFTLSEGLWFLSSVALSLSKCRRTLRVYRYRKA